MGGYHSGAIKNKEVDNKKQCFWHCFFNDPFSIFEASRSLDKKV